MLFVTTSTYAKQRFSIYMRPKGWFRATPGSISHPPSFIAPLCLYESMIIVALISSPLAFIQVNRKTAMLCHVIRPSIHRHCAWVSVSYLRPLRYVLVLFFRDDQNPNNMFLVIQSTVAVLMCLKQLARSLIWETVSYVLYRGWGDRRWCWIKLFFTSMSQNTVGVSQVWLGMPPYSSGGSQDSPALSCPDYSMTYSMKAVIHHNSIAACSEHS